MNEFLKGTKIGRIGKKAPYSYDAIPNLDGKVAIVTGATTGLGRTTAVALAKNGATVVVAARKSAEGEPPAEQVVKAIQKEAGSTKVQFLELDLGNLKMVQQFCDAFKAQFNHLDILVNNAGVSLCPFIKSADGLELHFAVNHLGHFHLTNQLLPLLKKSSSRIVFVSSRHHQDSYPEGVRLTKEQVNDDVNFTPSEAYGHSKLCNILTAKELNRRLTEENPNHQVYINLAHPGFVNAKGVLRGVKQSKGKFAYYAGGLFMDVMALSLKQGALTQTYLATAPEIESKNIRAQYFGPIAEPYAISDFAKDEKLGRRLWDFSEKLVEELL